MTEETKQPVLPKIKLISSILLLIIALGITGYYILFPSRGYFHSDTTDTIMWAEASYESGSVFNPDFAYACLLPFGTNLIMTALMPFTGVSMTTHVVGMLIFFLLFSGGLILMLRQMGWKWGWTAAAVFVELMICSGSVKLREIFWGHTIYYSLGVFFIFIGLTLVFRHMDCLKSSSKKGGIFCLIGLGIWCLLTGSDQITAITIFILPVMGAVFCTRWFDRETKIISWRNCHAIVVLFVMLIGMLTGFLLTKIFAGEITASYEEAYSQYSDMSQWADNLRKFPTAWLSLIGVEAKANTPLMSVDSVGSLLKVIVGILLLILPLLALLNWNKIQDEKLRILILTYWFMAMLIMMGYIMGKLSAANWRLSPIAGMSAVVSIAFLRWGCSQIEWQRLSALLMIPVMIVSVLNAVTMARMPADNTEDNELYALSEKLQEHNLTYGYATFWQANAITVISDSQVKCRSVEVDERGVWTRNYQCNKNWYEEQPEQENYFLLLTNNEANQLRAIDYILLRHPHEEIYAGNYVIWVFNKNII